MTAAILQPLAQNALLDPEGEEGAVFSFTSGGRRLVASGLRERISLPSQGGDDKNSAFQRAILDAFDRASSAGLVNPVIVGALPFDPAEPSCLYIPEHAEWEGRSSVPAPGIPLEVPLLERTSTPDESGFKRAVEHAILNFGFGEVDKAVLAVIQELSFAGDVDPGSIMANLRAQNREGYQFQVPLPDGGSLVGVSPELLVRRDGARLVANPLAGSARRAADAEADRAIAEQLVRSEKDQHEHRLVVRDIVARLGGVCSHLNVPKEPSLINTATLWHLSTRIEGELQDERMTALQLACLLHPTPAVCGYPTERARQLIRFVEPFERGLFSGMVGWCDAQGNGEWAVTIRCGIVNGNVVRLFAGAGIVQASSPDSEWDEVQTKLGTMLRACGVAVPCSSVPDKAIPAQDQASGGLREWLRARVEELIEDGTEIDPEENLIFYGLDSLQVMKLAAELKQHGVVVSFEELARDPRLTAWWTLIDKVREAA